MKRVPISIKRLLQQIKSQGFYGYLIGRCLEYELIGNEVDCWIILTNASEAALKKTDLKIKEEGKINSNNRIYNLEYKRKDNSKSTLEIVIQRQSDSAEEYFEDKLFTIDAVGFDGEEYYDPYEGKSDIENEVIDLLYEPKEYLEQNPQDLLTIVEKVSETGYNLSNDVHSAMTFCRTKMTDLDKKLITEKFQKIMTGRFTGKALRVMDETGVLAFVVGERLYKNRNKKERDAFQKYIQNIDQTKRILDRRIISFYLGFWKRKDMRAMDFLDYDNELKEKLRFAHQHLSDLYYLHKPTDLKDYLYKYGLEMYNFVDNISKVQAKVYGLKTDGIGRRYMILQKIAAENEPVFLADLSMNAETLIKEDLAKDQQDAESLLHLLVCIVHRHPSYNEPHLLLSQAYRLNKNPLKKYYYKYLLKKL